ncbi:GAF domain-containing protein [candidate division KSB1 bacterium]|nr:GAF domain-containing protein [candidate division KSB1 bacterium]
MSDLLLQEQKSVAILSTISELIASKENLLDILTEVRQYIKILIPCDYVSIILNNEKSRYFYLIPALYDSDAPIREEIIVHYNETALTDILRTRASMQRLDLSIRGALTPGDLKFMEEDIESDMAVPIFHDRQVIAIIHASSYESPSLSEIHQEMLEEIAVLVSMAVDRIYLHQEVKELEENVASWKDKYHFLMTLSNDPIILLSRDLESIYEVNQKFEHLSGYTSMQLSSMKFSHVHPKMPAHVISQIIRETRNGVVSSVKELGLRHQNGTEILVDCRFSSFTGINDALLIAVYEPKLAEKDSLGQGSGVSCISYDDMALLNKSELTPSDLVADLSLLVCHTGALCQAKYVIIHSVKDGVVDSQILCARQHPFSGDEDLDLPVSISISEGPYQSIVDHGKSVFYGDVLTATEYFEWLPIAQNLGYRAFASYPLKSYGQIIGLMSMYWADEQVADENRGMAINQIASIMTLVMDNYHYRARQTQHDLRMNVMKDVAASASSAETMEQLVETMANVFTLVYPYDVFMLTLFNGSPEKYNLFAIASKSYGDLFEPEAWHSFDGEAYGWLTIPADYNSGKGKINSVTRWSNKLQSSMNTLLLHGGKYMGTLTLSSMHPEQYSNEQRLFLEQICPLIAQGIHRINLEQEIRLYHQIIRDVERVCSHLNTLQDHNAMIRELLNAIGSIINPAFCSYTQIRKNVIDHHVFADESVSDEMDMHKFEERIVIPQALESKEAILISDVGSKGQKLGLLNFNYSSYLGVPLMDSDTLIGMVNIYMVHPGKVDEYKFTFIKVLCNQLALLRSTLIFRKEYDTLQKRIENSNRDLDRLLSSMSHNLKSYIDAIQGFSAIMMNDMRTMLNDDNKKYLYRIRDYADRMEFYLRDLTELSNIDRTPNVYEEVDTGKILDLVMSEYVFDIEDNKVKIEIPRNLPMLYCDKKRMLIVFKKLFENAIQNIDHGKDQAVIQITFEEDERSVTFQIHDNGVGISSEFIPDIFTLFYSIESDSSEVQGSGLGLPIVKRIIESHNGMIDVISEPGYGSTFYFTIPKNRTV